MGPPKKKERRLTPLDESLPEPALKVPAEGFAVHMMGIGGTGVVTVNQILGTAAMLDGKHVRGLDQTGLSQKGGPVVSDLKIASSPLDLANKISAGGADLYLGFDLLVATDPGNLDKAESGRTIAVVSTSRIPTGQMVQDAGVQFPELSGMLMGIDRVTRKDPNVYLDALAMAEGLFDDHMAINPILMGAAYQAGALPISRRVHRAGDPAQRRVGGDESPRVPVGADGGGGRQAGRGRGEEGLRPGGRGLACCPPRPGPSSTQAGVTGEARRLARGPRARADRLPERGLRAAVRRVRAARGRRGGAPDARAHRRDGRRGALPLQAHGLQGRVRGRAAASRRGRRRRSSARGSASRSAISGTCIRRCCARSG